MKKIGLYHWLHPVYWMCWILLIKYGVHLLFWSNDYGVNMLLYLLVPALYIAPVFLFDVKPIYFYQRTLNDLKFGKYKSVIAVYVGLVLLRLFFIIMNGFWYGSLKTFMPSWFYFLVLVGWIFSYFVLTVLSSDQKSKSTRFIIAIELAIILLVGFREWLIIYGMGVLAVFHLYRFYVNKRWLLYGLIVFLILISPLVLMTRYVQYEFNQTDKETTQILQAAINSYPDLMKSGLKRLGAEGLVLEEITSQWSESGITTDHSINKLGTEVSIATTPRILWDDKPELQPGKKVYETFISSDNPEEYSYPSGLLGDITRYFGLWSLLVIPLLSTFLIFLWNNLFVFISQKTLWLGLHYFYFHIFYDIHLIFWATSWLRDGIIYAVIALIGYLMINYFKD